MHTRVGTFTLAGCLVGLACVTSADTASGTLAQFPSIGRDQVAAVGRKRSLSAATDMLGIANALFFRRKAGEGGRPHKGRRYLPGEGTRRVQQDHLHQHDDKVDCMQLVAVRAGVTTADSYIHGWSAGAHLEQHHDHEHKRVGGSRPLLLGLVRGGERPGELAQGLKTLVYFALWFALNVYYNIINKKVLIALPLSISIATLQLGIGLLYVLLMWLFNLRARPQPSKEGLKSLWPIAAYHGIGQIFTVISLGAAAVSFAHIVKALEPFFSAITAAVMYKQVFPVQVYASMVPVVAGVAIACANEISFTWLAFLSAMTSNLAFALRANASKGAMVRFKAEVPTEKVDPASLSAANIYGLVTVMSFILCAPIATALEGAKWAPTWKAALTKLSQADLMQMVALSGLFHYLNNEVMYLALDNVHPITLAVGNTAKRVFIIIASVLVFRNPISLTGAVGSAVGILGVLVYSLTKYYYDNLAASAARQKVVVAVASPRP